MRIIQKCIIAQYHNDRGISTEPRRIDITKNAAFLYCCCLYLVSGHKGK